MERLSITDYQPAIDGFQPENFDPRRWADDAVKAGMRYAVMVAKHHEGFCLFDSQLTDYTSMRNGYGRDLVREFLDAFRERGIKVGLYYSLLDWQHPDYPAYDDEHHPHRCDPAWADHRPDFDRYLTYMHAQVEELVTGYGKLDILWFDFSYGSMVGDKWKARELLEMVRRNQPDILINNRLETSGGGFGSIVEAEPSEWAGDWVSPEQLIPAEGIRNVYGDPVPWEACFTHNNNWGYFRGDTAFKSPRTIIRKLVEIVSKGGNMLLNVGPQPDGSFPDESVRALREVGAWLERNGDSVYGASASDIPKPEWGYYTRRGDTLYAHVFEGPIGPLAISGIDKTKVRSARLLMSGQTLEPVSIWLTEPYPEVLFLSLGENPQFTYPPPDEIDTVIAIDFEPGALN